MRTFISSLTMNMEVKLDFQRKLKTTSALYYYGRLDFSLKASLTWFMKQTCAFISLKTKHMMF